VTQTLFANGFSEKTLQRGAVGHGLQTGLVVY